LLFGGFRYWQRELSTNVGTSTLLLNLSSLGESQCKNIRVATPPASAGDACRLRRPMPDNEVEHDIFLAGGREVKEKL